MNSVYLLRVLFAMGMVADILFLSSMAFAEETQTSKEPGYIYLTAGGDGLVIFPNKAYVGVGAGSPGGYIEGELFAAVDFFSTLDNNELPLGPGMGAKVRFYPAGQDGRGFFGEVEYVDYTGDQYPQPRIRETFSVGAGIKMGNWRISAGYMNLQYGPDSQFNKRELDTMYTRGTYIHKFLQ